ncbi:PQQ-binding-like beta-propeller repeat protein [bacterium]|nr:PQQ-binding-like beta-propeller repeat protein [bacterium]
MTTVIWTSLCLLAATISGGEWPQFRGPQGDGHSPATQLPTTWSETENVAWKTAVPGRGWSSPVLADGLIWLTSAVEHKPTAAELEAIKKDRLGGNPMADQMTIVGSITLRAIAVDAATGKIKHDIKLLDVKDPQPVHSLNSYASPSPVLADGRLVCHFGAYGTACVDTATGEILWKTKLEIDHSVGPGSSPVVFEDLLIIPCDGTDKQFVAALNLVTGKVAWETPRPPMAGDKGDLHKAFSTPYLAMIAGEPQAIIVGAQWVVSYEPRTGKEIWRLNHGVGFSNVPRPVIGNGFIYICTGFMRPELLAIPENVQGEVKTDQVAWKFNRQVPAQPSPILAGREIYFVSDQGVATCLDAMTGESLWTQRMAGNYSASPLAADGNLYFCSREGVTTVIKPGRDYTEVASNQLEGQLMASPAATDGRLYLRTDTHLYAIGK